VAVAEQQLPLASPFDRVVLGTDPARGGVLMTAFAHGGDLEDGYERPGIEEKNATRRGAIKSPVGVRIGLRLGCDG
jgi:hypothetical protein